MHRPRISCLFLSCQAVALRRLVFLLSLILPFVAFAATKSPIQERADRFLALANAGYQALFRVNSEAQWLAVTDVTPEHDAAAEATAKAYAAFNGNPAIIKEARELLTHQKELSGLTVRQLKQLLLNAAEGPMTNPELVAKRVEAETKQASILPLFAKLFINVPDTKIWLTNPAPAGFLRWEGPIVLPNDPLIRVDLLSGTKNGPAEPEKK